MYSNMATLPNLIPVMLVSLHKPIQRNIPYTYTFIYSIYETRWASSVNPPEYEQYPQGLASRPHYTESCPTMDVQTKTTFTSMVIIISVNGMIIVSTLLLYQDLAHWCARYLTLVLSLTLSVPSWSLFPTRFESTFPT